MKIKHLIAILFFSYSQLTLANCFQEERAMEEGKRFFENGHYLISAQTFGSLKIFASDECHNFPFRASYFQAASYLKLSDVKAFELSYQDLLLFAKTDAEKEKILTLRAYAYSSETLSGVKPGLKERWHLYASRNEKSVYEQDQNPYLSSDVLEAQKKYLKNKNSKKPWVAGTLSAILPGAGQAYIGAYQSAFLAFAFNALTLGSTLEFHRRNLDFPAVAAGTLFTMTYLGNIVNATQGAQKLNETRSAEFERALRLKLIPELEF